jgi:hypothetical protein
MNFRTLSLSCLLFLFFFTSFIEDFTDRGLVAYYSFNQCDARDDSGNESDGIIFGKTTCACGVEGDGIVLDGMKDYIEFNGGVNNYFTTSDFTISFYFKANKYSIFNQSMLSKRSECDESFMMDIQLNAGQKLVDVDLFESPERYFKYFDADLDETVWMHLAIVREGIHARTYINGVLVKESVRCSGVDLTNDAVLSFANSPCIKGGRSVRFKGVLDELRIYERALSEEEVMELYARHPVEMAEGDCVT